MKPLANFEFCKARLYRTLSTNFTSKYPSVKLFAMNCIIKGISAKCKQKRDKKIQVTKVEKRN